MQPLDQLLAAVKALPEWQPWPEAARDKWLEAREQQTRWMRQDRWVLHQELQRLKRLQQMQRCLPETWATLRLITKDHVEAAASHFYSDITPAVL